MLLAVDHTLLAQKVTTHVAGAASYSKARYVASKLVIHTHLLGRSCVARLQSYWLGNDLHLILLSHRVTVSAPFLSGSQSQLKFLRI